MQQANQLLFDGLTVLQHRGQDAAGIVTVEQKRLHLRKDNGLVKDVFMQHHMLELRGNIGIGHCRYPTTGTSSCAAEAQPLYTNFPHGIAVAHNGNLTNPSELAEKMNAKGRHVNTDSDSELLLNVFADALASSSKQNKNDEGEDRPPTSEELTEEIMEAMTTVMTSCKGGFAGLYLINGFGLVGFRDPNGIRPLVFGCRTRAIHAFDKDGVPRTPSVMSDADGKLDYVIASESVAIDTLGFKLVR